MPRKGWVLRRKIPGDPVYRQRPGAEVYFEHDVRRQALDRAGDFLQGDGPGGEKDQRRCVQAVQEGRRELQAGAGSEDATRGRRELSGSGGSESVPPAIAGDSLAGAVFADPRRARSMTDKLAEKLWTRRMAAAAR